MMRMVMFFVICMLFMFAFFVFGFYSKKRVYSRRIKRWITKTNQPGRIVATFIYVCEGISVALLCVFSGTFTKILNVSFNYAEADINPFYVLMSVIIATAIFIGVVVYLSKFAYKLGQVRKERHLSSGR